MLTRKIQLKNHYEPTESQNQEMCNEYEKELHLVAKLQGDPLSFKLECATVQKS